MNIENIWNSWKDKNEFSGVFSISGENRVIFEKSSGYRNMNEKLKNRRDTAFSIASGTKLFTGLAVCKLIDERKLSLDDKVWDVLNYELGLIDKTVTVRQLLTHTSGIGDYIDEESTNSTDQLQALYNLNPVYLWENLNYYLPMLINIPQKFTPGERFGYSNSGFVLLGLIIEAISDISYQDYVQNEIITPGSLGHTGFYRMDMLPANTALGYILNNESGEWQSNIFKLPVRGGSDGGLYTCAQDLDKLWREVFSGRILSDTMLECFLNLHVKRNENRSYGLGVYRYQKEGRIAYYAVGSDFGIDFFTAYFPEIKIAASALGNTEINTFPLLRELLEEYCHA